MDADDEVPMAVSLTEQAGTTRATREIPSYRQNLSLDGPLKPVPVTLITGYLGAGKSTLINRILNTQHGYRCAVLMNEFGESADVERALIKEPEGEEASPLANWVQLENGCICCSVKNDMVKALEALLQQRASFDYILIETTGLANPGPVAAALWTDAELEAGVCLDAVVTVVDARNIRRQLADPPGEGAEVCEAAAQIAFADVVLLNKEDLVSEEELRAAHAELAGINGSAAVLACARCGVDLKYILDTGIYSGTGRLGVEEDPDACRPGCSDPCHRHGVSHGHDSKGQHRRGHAPDTVHASDIWAVTLRCEKPLDLRRLRLWMDGLLWERRSHGPDLFRVKAVLSLAGEGRRHVMQAVHDLYDVVPAAPWAEGEARASKLVLIGRRLEEGSLQRGLDECVAS
ncbi:ZNG1 [Auxenochlorella protothecoides x Auxenochlorella symbiontica]